MILLYILLQYFNTKNIINAIFSEKFLSTYLNVKNKISYFNSYIKKAYNAIYLVIKSNRLFTLRIIFRIQCYNTSFNSN